MEKASKDEVELSFEEALKRLEQIVEFMEEGDVALDDLVRKYEEGNRLLSICGKRLRDAELKIEQLKKTATGDTVAPFEEADNT